MKRHLKIPAHLAPLTFCIFLGCGAPGEEAEEPILRESQPAKPSSEANNPSKFELVNADAFQIKVEGCASGAVLNISEAQTSVKLFKDDANCKAKLLSFTKSSSIYTPAPGMNFTTYAANDVATFINGNLETLDVTILSQLSNPILVTDVISFRTGPSAIKGNSANLLDCTAGTTGSYAGTADAPALNFVYAKLVGADPTTRAGKFEIGLECQQPLKKGNGSVGYLCGKVSLKSIRYTLGADSYNDRPCSNSQGPSGCQALIAAGPTANIATAEVFPAGTGGFVKGGVKLGLTTGGVRGPEDMATHANMLVVLEYLGSYTYHNIDIKISLNLLLHQMALMGLEADNGD